MKPPIFICGTGRSGTTIVQRCLADHPRLWSTRYESRFLVAPGGLFALLAGEVQEAALERFRKKMLGEWYRRTFRPGTSFEYEGGLFVDVDRHYLAHVLEVFVTELPVARDRAGRLGAVRRLVDAVFEPGLESKGAERLLEKTRANIVYLNELHQLYPEAKTMARGVLARGREDLL